MSRNIDTKLHHTWKRKLRLEQEKHESALQKAMREIASRPVIDLHLKELFQDTRETVNES